MIRTASRLQALRPSPIHAMAQRARDARACGREILDLTLGEPDFDTPAHIVAAAIEAMRSGRTHYTPIHGTPELRQAIRARELRRHGIAWAEDEVTTGCGGKQVIFNALLATLEPGDEVVLPAPYWGSYADAVTLLGGRAVTVACREADGFRLGPEQLEAAITPRSRWLFLNTPSNPAGVAYTAAELQALAEVLRRHPALMVLSDDIYDEIVYQADAAALLDAAPDLRDRVLVVNGVSKTYAMCGWRLGYACGPRPLIAAMGTVQTQNATHTSSITQAAAVAALQGPQDCVAEFLRTYRRRRDLLAAAFADCRWLRSRLPAGAFYLFPSVAPVLGARTPDGRRLEDDAAVADYLLDAAGVATVPGSGFAMPGHLRLSFAGSDALLRRAAAAVTEALERLQPP